MKVKKKSLINPKNTKKEAKITKVVESTKKYDTLFGDGYALEMFQGYVKGGMPPKSAARSTLRMLKKLEFDELMDRFEGSFE